MIANALPGSGVIVTALIIGGCCLIKGQDDGKKTQGGATEGLTFTTVVIA